MHWLAPEPNEDLVRLQAALQTACSDCDDQRLRDEWQRTWQPIRFELSAIAVLRREQDTPFEIVKWASMRAGDA